MAPVWSDCESYYLFVCCTYIMRKKNTKRHARQFIVGSICKREEEENLSHINDVFLVDHITSYYI